MRRAPSNRTPLRARGRPVANVAAMVAPVVIAEVVRSGFVEGHHHGSWVALSADGSVAASAGDATGPVLPRSCNKPVQALAMVEAGLPLDGELLALSCASHSGEDFHIEGVRRILAEAGLGEDALQTPPDWPLDDTAREALLRAGGAKAPVLMNCSGKHAAMLLTCVVNGWPTETYLQPDHPLQQAIHATFERVTGEPVAHVAIDGCGAPLLATSLTGLARAFAAIATGEGAAARIAAARSGRTRRTSPAAPATSAVSWRRSRARSARPVRSPATPSPCPTAGPSRRRPTTGRRGPARC